MRLNFYLSDQSGERIELCPIGAATELQAVERALRSTYAVRCRWRATALVAVDAETGEVVIVRT